MKKLIFITLSLISHTLFAASAAGELEGMTAQSKKDPIWAVVFTVGAPTFVPSVTLMLSTQALCEYVADKNELGEDKGARMCLEALLHPGFGSSVTSEATKIFVSGITVSNNVNKELLAAGNEDAAIYLAAAQDGQVSAVLQECFDYLDQDQVIKSMDLKSKAKMLMIINDSIATSTKI